MCPGRRVADSKHLPDIALKGITSRLFQDCPQRRLQSDPIGGLLAYGNVRLQTVKRATPVGASPRRRLIHAAFAGARQPLGHGISVLRPDVGDCPVAILCPRDTLDVGGEAFGEPVVVSTDLGQREVHHFVDQHPVSRQRRGGGFAAHAHLNHQAAVIGGAAAVDAAAIHRPQPNHDQRRGKLTVIIRDNVRGAIDPGAQQRLLLFQRGIVHDDANPRVAQLQLQAHRIRARAHVPSAQNGIKTAAPTNHAGRT